MNKKQILAVIIILLITSCTAASGSDANDSTRNIVIGNGIGLGGALAITISWSKNKSILWAIIHGFLNWFYVIY